MRPVLLLPCALLGALLTPVAASASVPHTVAPGESLWGLAAAQNMTTRAFAAANGISPDTRIVAGTTIQLPTVAEAAAALQSVAPISTSTTAAPPAATTSASAS